MASPSSRTSYRRLSRDERREQILGVARTMFTEVPYAEVSTAAIADRAGVRRGLIHYYFGTKRDLFLEVVRVLAADVSVVAPPVGDLPPMPLEETVELLVRLYMETTEVNAETWFAAADAEGFGQDPELLRITNKARDVTVEHMIALLRVARPTETLRAVLRAYAGLAEATTRQWLQEKTLDREQARVLLSRSLLALLTDVVPALES
ncbi:TetR/AcrR family transcriptional regulator [Spirillospora sp. CA-294931]|uniref:TetR/AcrR family transcriptional regulator n=1 Tax=Spirillospora sp. CA-294931 TaxID=3240042 RepID=UPI003D8C44C2